MKARKLLEAAAVSPETLMVMGKAFDDAWADITPVFGNDAERARLQLAHAVLAVAQDGQDCEDLKGTVLQVMALAHPDLPRMH